MNLSLATSWLFNLSDAYVLMENGEDGNRSFLESLCDSEPNTLRKLSLLAMHDKGEPPYRDNLIFTFLLLFFNPCLSFLHVLWDQRSCI